MSYLQEKIGAVVLRVKALPGSKRDEVRGVDGGALKVAVAAPPEKGRANKALLAVLAEFFGVPRRDVVIISGEASRDKRVEVAGVTAVQVEEKLAQLKR
ncbi:YggU family protein [bacterium]|nr:YggU family protein [bacterium]